MNDALIFAKQLDGNGGARNHPSLETLDQASGTFWMHFDANHSDAHSAVKAAAPDMDEQSLLAIFDQDARPRILELDNGILVILRGINLNKGEDPEDMIAVRLWITDQRIISLRYRRSKALIDVAESLDHGRGPKTVGEIVTSISAKLFSHIEHNINALNDKVDDLESNVIDHPNRQLRKDILEVRKSAIQLRRYIAPQKEAINQLRYAEISWLTPKNLRRIQESQDSLLRSIEDLDSIRERSQVVKDELVNTLSDKLNRNLYVLSVVTAIFLPLGFLTGLFGINIGGMPGVDDETAFTLFSLGLAVIVLVQVALFKYFKWF